MEVMRSGAALQSPSRGSGRFALVSVALLACSDPGETMLRVVHNHVVVAAEAPVSPAVDTVAAVAAVDTTPEPGPDTFDPPDVVDTVPTPTLDTSLPDTTPDVVFDTALDIVAAACPVDMRELASACIDRWEAPNIAGESPLVMYTFDDAEAWCAARDKRLCFDDEWLVACAGATGAAGLAYPYGDVREPGRCNDDRVWRVYTQGLLNGWPGSASSPAIDSLADLLQAARDRSATAASAADHVLSLYQGTAAGERPACVGPSGVEDLVGNVEEWVRRRDGGAGPQFSGALVGRYWAESRTCQSRVTVHGNAFRFYEIGFRCCRDLSQ